MDWALIIFVAICSVAGCKMFYSERISKLTKNMETLDNENKKQTVVSGLYAPER